MYNSKMINKNFAENKIGSAKKKPRGRPFAKGVSGNPGGRPKDLLGEIIRGHAGLSEELVAGVLKIFRAPQDQGMQLRAAEWLADRGWGKPAQQVESDSIIAIFAAAGMRYSMAIPGLQ